MNKPWWLNVKFVLAVLSELLTLAVLIMTAAGVPVPLIDQIKDISVIVFQLIALVLGTWWGNEVGVKRTSGELDGPA